MPSSFTKMINLVGEKSEYNISIENGDTRVSHNWNSSPNGEYYLKSDENAFNLNIGTVTNPYLKIRHAGKGIAGEAISWNEHLVIKQNGFLGVNKANPEYRLDIGGPARFLNSNIIKGVNSDYLINTEDSSGRIQHYWNSTKGSDGKNKYLKSGENSFKLDIGVVTDPYFKIKHARKGIANETISWNEHFTIRKNGWIGINKPNPSCRLDVNGSASIRNNLKIHGPVSNFCLSLQDGSGRIQNYWNSTRGKDENNKYLVSNEESFKLDLGINRDPYYKIKHAAKGVAGESITWNEHLVIKQNGNIGIGSSDPIARLDVNGNLHVNGNINFTNNLTKNGSNFNFSDLEGTLNFNDLEGVLDLSKVSNILSIANGGTGATTAAGARDKLGVDVAGTDNSTNVTLSEIASNYLSISGQEITSGVVPLSLGGTGAVTAEAARTSLGVDAAGTDNSTNVTLANTDYLSISGQELTGGTVPISSGGTGANTVEAARTALGVDPAGTDNSIDVTLANTDYLSISGQEITGRIIPITSGGTGANSAASARFRLGVDAAGTDNSTNVTLANTNYLSISGQEITGGIVPIASGGTGAITAQEARTSLGIPSTFNELSGEIKINDSTKIFYSEITVTVSGGKYYIDGTQQQLVNLQKGLTYRFNLEDSTITGHTFKLSTTNDGLHNGGSEYTTNVTSQGTPGESGSYLQIVIEQDTPLLYYYCFYHSGMGGKIFTGEELDYLDIATLGTSQSSKVLTADANGNVTIEDGTNDFDIASHDGTNGLKLGGTLVTSTATEINKLDVTNTVPNQSPWASISRWARISYNFNSSGGSQGTVNLTGTIPNNSIIIGGFVDVTTGLASSSNSANCSLEIVNTGDLVASIAINNQSSPWSIGIKSIVPNGTGGNAIKLSSNKTIDFIISSEDLTEGAFDLWLEYLIGS